VGGTYAISQDFTRGSFDGHAVDVDGVRGQARQSVVARQFTYNDVHKESRPIDDHARANDDYACADDHDARTNDDDACARDVAWASDVARARSVAWPVGGTAW